MVEISQLDITAFGPRGGGVWMADDGSKLILGPGANDSYDIQVRVTDPFWPPSSDWVEPTADQWTYDSQYVQRENSLNTVIVTQPQWSSNGGSIYIPIDAGFTGDPNLKVINLDTFYTPQDLTAVTTNVEDIDDLNTNANARGFAWADGGQSVVHCCEGFSSAEIAKFNDTHATTGPAYEITNTALYATGWGSRDSEYTCADGDGQPRGIAFSEDGTKMFYWSLEASAMIYGTCSPAWDITTFTKVGSWTPTAGNFGWGFTFSKQGNRLYALISNDVYSWTLGTAWDMSTCPTAHDAFLDSSVNKPGTQSWYTGLLVEPSGNLWIFGGDSFGDQCWTHYYTYTP